MLFTIAAGCGQAKPRRAVSNPSEAVAVLKQEGYRPVPGVPLSPRPGVFINTGFDTKYGQPVAFLEKGDLRVIVVRGNGSTPRPPGALWYRSGDTILIGWSSGSSGRAQFQSVTGAL
jgi:hypothetical protein